MSPRQRHVRERFRRLAPEELHPPFNKLLDIASRHGLRVSISEVNEACWNGRGRITVRPVSNPKEIISDLAHELGHYAIATPKMRSIEEFGLGPGPSSKRYGLQPQIDDWATGEHLEEQASLFGMLIEQWAGHDPLSFTWDYHDWSRDRSIDSSSSLVWKILRGFRRLGLLRGFATETQKPSGRVKLAFRRDEFTVTWLNKRHPFIGWQIPFCEGVLD